MNRSQIYLFLCITSFIFISGCEIFHYEHDGLYWSDKTENTSLQFARIHCNDLGGKLPTISELRTVVEKCNTTETDGACNVTSDCLSEDCYEELSCVGCPSDITGKYSAFGDADSLWSSSLDEDDENYAWIVNFKSAEVRLESVKNTDISVRCLDFN